MQKKILKIYAITILLGVLTGLAGSIFQIVINHFSTWITSLNSLARGNVFYSLMAPVTITVFLVMSAWLLVQKFAPEAAGSGVQEIEGCLLHKRPINWRRLLPVKFFGGIFAISAQMVVGREGPTIQMGGNLGDMLGEKLGIHRGRRDTLIAAGSAAGLATAFNAPLAGVLFVIEEMRNQFNFTFTNFKMVAICCVVATFTTQSLLGKTPAIPMVVFTEPSLRSLSLFFIFGIAIGFVGLIFNKALMFSLGRMDGLSKLGHFYYVLVVAFVVAILAVLHPAVVGGGYDIIQESLHLFPSFPLLLALIVSRFITTMLCYSTGVPGGIFAPMLALGTLLGLAGYDVFIQWLPDLTIHPGMFAVAGMGALFSAAVRAPLTGIVLVVEMTQNYALILPLMVSCLTSTTVVQLARNRPIYTQLLQRALKKHRAQGL